MAIWRLWHIVAAPDRKRRGVLSRKRQSAAKVLASLGWKPIQLAAKEGLALLNGTQFMTAYGVHCLIRAYKISYYADLIGAVSLDAFNGNMNAFDPLVHIVRPHRGQVKTAERILEILKDSEIGKQEEKAVQDPYSFRCIPQVHGATKDTLHFVHKTLKTEMNSVTDNPNIFMNEDRIISGGNFHGQPLALALVFFRLPLLNWEIFQNEERISSYREHAGCLSFWSTIRD